MPRATLEQLARLIRARRARGRGGPRARSPRGALLPGHGPRRAELGRGRARRGTHARPPGRGPRIRASSATIRRARSWRMSWAISGRPSEPDQDGIAIRCCRCPSSGSAGTASSRPMTGAARRRRPGADRGQRGRPRDPRARARRRRYRAATCNSASISTSSATASSGCRASWRRVPWCSRSTGAVLALASVPSYDPEPSRAASAPRSGTSCATIRARRWSTSASAASTRRARPSRWSRPWPALEAGVVARRRASAARAPWPGQCPLPLLEGARPRLGQSLVSPSSRLIWNSR